MKLLQKIKYVWVVCFCAIFLLTSSATLAAGGTTVSPTSLRFSVSEQKIVDQQPVLVKNNTTTVQSYTATILDVDTETGTLLPVSLVSQNSQNHFTLSLAGFTLQPQQSINLIVSAKNSSSLSAGGHYAMLSIQQVVPQQPRNKQINTIQQSIGVGLFMVKEDGAKRSVVLQSEKQPRVWFSVPKKIVMKVTNDGNTDVVPRGFVAVTKAEKTLSKTSINENSNVLFEGKTATFEVQTAVGEFLWPGKYKVTQSLRYEGQPDQYVSIQSVWYIPTWSIVLAAIFVCILVGIMYAKQRRRKNRSGNKAAKTGAHHAEQVVVQVEELQAVPEQIEHSKNQSSKKIVTIKDRTATAVRSHVKPAKKNKRATTKNTTKVKKTKGKSPKNSAKKTSQTRDNK